MAKSPAPLFLFTSSLRLFASLPLRLFAFRKSWINSRLIVFRFVLRRRLIELPDFTLWDFTSPNQCSFHRNKTLSRYFVQRNRNRFLRVEEERMFRDIESFVPYLVYVFIGFMILIVWHGPDKLSAHDLIVTAMNIFKERHSLCINFSVTLFN